MIYGINDLKLWSQESAACTFRIYKCGVQLLVVRCQMKLWGWWRRDEPPKQPEKPQMLDDLPPKFDDDVEGAQKAQQLVRPKLSQILQSLSWQDFQQIPQMPCFRNAMLTGFGMGGVAGVVTLVSRRNVTRTLNWSLMGFLVGSIVSWEQCRFRLMRGKRNMRHAQELYRHKEEED